MSIDTEKLATYYRHLLSPFLMPTGIFRQQIELFARFLTPANSLVCRRILLAACSKDLDGDPSPQQARWQGLVVLYSDDAKPLGCAEGDVCSLIENEKFLEKVL